MRHLLAGVLIVAAAGCRPDMAAKQYAAGKDSLANGTLTKEESAFLQAVCKEGIATSFEPKHRGDFQHREVVLRTAVEELHMKKRVAVLRFLLGVVKEGKPKDALTAGVTALTLEEGGVYGTCVWDQTDDAFDEARADGLPTKRWGLIEILEEKLASAEAEQKQGQDR